MHKLRVRERKDYAALHEGKMPKKRNNSSDEEVDIPGKQELVEDDQDYLDLNAEEEEEDEFPEEGEISDSEDNKEDDEFAELIQKYTKEGNIKKLKQIVKIKKQKCEQLRKELVAEQWKEREKELNEVLSELSKINKRKSDLERSLANSRSNSPDNSPKHQKTRTTTKSTVKRQKVSSMPPTSRGRRSCKTPAMTSKGRKSTSEEKSEYEDILHSFLNLKQGHTDNYSELVEKAMNATDNIIKLKNNQKSNIAKCRKPLDFESKSGKQDNNSDKNNALKLLNALQTIVSKGKSLNSKTIIEVLNELGQDEGIQGLESVNTSTIETINEPNHDNLPTQDKVQETKNTEGSDRKKKLVSGKCTKPDEADIKKVVHFPHKKLDPRHTNIGDRHFDKLSFHLLVAGELEIAADADTGESEKQARINIAKTICYHWAYLKDEDLRDGYDQLQKSVEQGKNDWNDNLGEKLHEFYDYQANKLI